MPKFRVNSLIGPVVLLLRHSARDDLPVNSTGIDVPITYEGQELAKKLGAEFGQRLKTIRTSPVIRCVQTAEALRDGAGINCPITLDRHLGAPGVYSIDSQRAWANWETRGHEGVVAHLVSSSDALPGMARPNEAARFLVHHMFAAANGIDGIHVFITHDTLVMATAARLLGKALGPEFWPGFLESVIFWHDSDGMLHTAYRDLEAVRDSRSLCSLAEGDVLEFARREIAATVGFDSGARFFLAGGAFKTLLTGKPPRDLDLWAPSARDRELMVQELIRRGAKRMDQRLFADAFEIHGRVVEVPHKVDAATLEELFQQSDIALSAIGVEHSPGEIWSVAVHAMAKKSFEERCILLLNPLVNWKYALTTLERMRRYAIELNFEIPPEEEAKIWQVFENQTAEIREAMVDRYLRTGTSVQGILDEIQGHLS
ncbi:MAG: histidine phosphatase family protein [Acidocella sp.]|nr:histidine phosphatase family protein [Acidocella sp.]